MSIDISKVDFAKADGLVPAIVQDADTGAVLMLAAWAAVIGFLILDVTTDEKVEQRLGSHRDAGLVLRAPDPAHQPSTTAAASPQPHAAGEHHQ